MADRGRRRRTNPPAGPPPPTSASPATISTCSAPRRVARGPQTFERAADALRPTSLAGRRATPVRIRARRCRRKDRGRARRMSGRRCSSQLNSVSRTRSGVGRRPGTSGTGSGVRFHDPPTMRTWRGAPAIAGRAFRSSERALLHSFATSGVARVSRLPPHAPIAFPASFDDKPRFFRRRQGRLARATQARTVEDARQHRRPVFRRRGRRCIPRGTRNGADRGRRRRVDLGAADRGAAHARSSSRD